MIAVFARPNHPHYKRDDGQDSGEWRYHGYVIALVRVSSQNQLEAVAKKLANDGLPEPYGHSYDQGWYGGRMDLIALLPGKNIRSAKKVWLPVRPNNEKQSIGDNRYAGFYDAKELL